VIALCVDRSCDARVVAVGADHDAGAFQHLRFAVGMPADTDNGAVLDDHLVDREGLAELGACCGGGVDQDLVEHRAPGGDRRGVSLDGARATGDGDRSEIERRAFDRWAPGVPRRARSIAVGAPAQRAPTTMAS